MNINEICVPIRDEKELQQAREILESNGEKINFRVFKSLRNEFNYLYFNENSNYWALSFKTHLQTEIPLSELEAVLRGENMDSSNVDSSNVDSKKQSSIDLFKKPFRRGKERKDTILDANGKYLFRLNKGQFSDELIDKIIESINND